MKKLKRYVRSSITNIEDYDLSHNNFYFEQKKDHLEHIKAIHYTLSINFRKCRLYNQLSRHLFTDLSSKQLSNILYDP